LHEQFMAFHGRHHVAVPAVQGGSGGGT
jgi:hypothetical protein